MENEMLINKPLFQLTVKEFLSLQRKEDKLLQPSNVEIEKSKKYVYGIQGLAKLLDCSKTKVHRIKKSGILDEAIIQNGRLIISDAQKVLDLMAKHQVKSNG